MELPVIDLSSYLSAVSTDFNSQLQTLCSDVSRNLSETGALLIKDPRCTVEDNDRFIDMMEKYFSTPYDFKILQERPQLHYQVHSVTN
jgi:DNA-binding transcriptional regulator YbjK